VLESLRKPLALGRVELPNRIVSTAHQTTLVHDHLPTDDFVAYHEARARGGAGMIVLEATAVHPSGLLTPHTLGGYLPEIVGSYERVAAAVRPQGTRLFVQLFHGGREQIASPPREPALAPSAVPSGRFGVEPRALRPQEIEDIVAGYGEAAALAAAGGLDGIEVSAAHRYLIEQFASEALNRRADAWRHGTRFLLAVVAAVRAAAPDLALGVRLSADSRDAPALAQALRPAGVDYLSLALGESSTYLGSTRIVPPPPVAEDAVVGDAARFAPGIPLVATSRIVDPAAADALIASGQVDAVGMTRALIADPDLPAKAFSGRPKEIVLCIGCNACIAHYHAGTPIACVMNARTGRELRLPRTSAATTSRRLVVVGAGPAGLAAAAEAALAGHDVVVLERGERIGGQMALAITAPGAAGISGALLEHFNRRIDRHDIDVRLRTAAGVDDIAALGPDGVVVATGARPFEPDLQLDGVTMARAWDVLAGQLPDGATAVVADWGGDPAGLDAAEVLRAAGSEVTLAIASVAVGQSVHQYRRNLYLQRLYGAGVRIEHHVELVGARNGAALFRNVFAPELELSLVADALVLAPGRVPEDDLMPRVVAAGLRAEEAGDCCSPRSLEEAILEGTLAARRVLAVDAR
jgi:2,4-dienoyl-CoA reductase-like NADH-dependent reductase (Old Yellow Enzyme family)/thioredoxin reductase